MRPGYWSILLLAGSLAVTVVFWALGFPFFFLFLFMPLLPFISGRKKILRCPACGWETTGSECFCPYDATPLEHVETHR